jgi:hypothetical protein
MKFKQDVQGHYNFIDDIITLNPNNPRNGILLKILTPKGSVLQTIKILDKKGKFAFITQECIIYDFIVF